jgi:phosphoribosyl 1,2-cyclic phosphodiesterase
MRRAPALHIRFWGVRGSHPVPGPATARVGGNSSCVEITAAGHHLVFDAGTGIIGLGQLLLHGDGDRSVHIFLSHTHHDHIEGLRFFQPAYDDRWTCYLYGTSPPRKTLEQLLAGVMTPSFFPVALSELPARLCIRTLARDERIVFRGSRAVEVQARYSRAHTKLGVTMYRVTCGGRSVVYATDIEAPLGGHDDVVTFARGADVLIHDAQYTDAEYHDGHHGKAGWGHSTVRMAAEVARAAGVGELLLYHHDPDRADPQMPALERLARRIFPQSRIATEGMKVSLAAT